MTQTKIEVARRLYPEALDYVVAFGPDGIDATRAALAPLVHPDLETVTAPGQVPLSGADTDDPSRPVVYGLDGLENGFRDWLSAWESWLVTATDLIDVDGDRVLVLLDVQARSKTHGVEMPIDAASLVTIRDGRLARMELFFEQDEARRAAGLVE